VWGGEEKIYIIVTRDRQRDVPDTLLVITDRLRQRLPERDSDPDPYIRIQEAKKNMNPTDSDPQLCLWDYLEKLAVMFLGHDELVDVLLSLGLMRLKSRGHARGNSCRPRLGLLLLRTRKQLQLEPSGRQRNRAKKD
jgi:hypothetical protein